MRTRYRLGEHAPDELALLLPAVGVHLVVLVQARPVLLVLRLALGMDLLQPIDNGP